MRVYTAVALAFGWTFHMTRYRFCNLAPPGHPGLMLPSTNQPLLYFHRSNWIIESITLVMSHAVQQGGRF